MSFGRLVAVLGCLGDAYGFGVVLGVFRKFLGDVLGGLGASWGVFLDVLRAARVVSGSFLSPR